MRAGEQINHSSVAPIRELLAKHSPEMGKAFVEVYPGSSDKQRRNIKIGLQENPHRSENLKGWITEEKEAHPYDHLDIFGYTDETKHIFIKSLRMHVRSLARNWVVEKEEEDKFNNQKHSSSGVRERRPWEKSHIIRMAAEIMADKGTANCLSLEQRYYETPPVINGAILWDSKSDKKAAYFGFYRWNPGRENGGSPYDADKWTAIRLDSDDELQSDLINTLQSRFIRAWGVSDSFGEVRQQHRDYNQKQVACQLWEIDRALPYKIVIPGVSTLRSSKVNAFRFPDVKYQDAVAAESVRKFISELGGEATIEIMPLPYFQKKQGQAATEKQLEKTEAARKSWYKKHIDNFEGHVVFICSRTMSQTYWEHLKEINFPYDFCNPTNEAHFIRENRTGHLYESPLDNKPLAVENSNGMAMALVDFCLLGRCSRPEADSVKGKCFLVIGIHSLGTNGGSQLLTRLKDLSIINERVNGLSNENNDFGLIVKVVTHPDASLNIKATIFDEPTKVE